VVQVAVAEKQIVGAFELHRTPAHIEGQSGRMNADPRRLAGA
jgi:hypothetical protein